MANDVIMKSALNYADPTSGQAPFAAHGKDEVCPHIPLSSGRRRKIESAVNDVKPTSGKAPFAAHGKDEVHAALLQIVPASYNAAILVVFAARTWDKALLQICCHEFHALLRQVRENIHGWSKVFDSKMTIEKVIVDGSGAGGKDGKHAARDFVRHTSALALLSVRGRLSLTAQQRSSVAKHFTCQAALRHATQTEYGFTLLTTQAFLSCTWLAPTSPAKRQARRSGAARRHTLSSSRTAKSRRLTKDQVNRCKSSSEIIHKEQLESVINSHFAGKLDSLACLVGAAAGAR